MRENILKTGLFNDIEIGTGNAAGERAEISGMTGARIVEVRKLDAVGASTDWVAEEVPVALVYNGISHAVMMTSPLMLEEFAIGFSLSEGIVGSLSDIYSIDVLDGCNNGKEVRITVASESFWKLKERRRSMVGRTGCGICGVESLSEAVRECRRVGNTQHFDMRHYATALEYLTRVERLGELTGCTHAAVWVNADGTYAGGAEDVGRHAALDKLLGLRAKNGWKDGALLVSSRASYEMVQKAAACGVEIMFAVSAPTALAIDMADRNGMTLAAFCRARRTNVYTHADRLIGL